MTRNKSNKKKNKNKNNKQNKQSNETTDQSTTNEDHPCVNNQQDDIVPAETSPNFDTTKLEENQEIENLVCEKNDPAVVTTGTTESVEESVGVEEVNHLNSVEEEPSENDLNLSVPATVNKEETTQDHQSKKKRFSFFKRNKKSSSVFNVTTESMNQNKKSKTNNEGGATVQRAQSLSTFDREPKSRIPLHKFRSEKKKNSNNLTASTSNVDSTSLVLNPGMDDWRMSGLLNNVRNKDSVHSLTLAPWSGDLPSVSPQQIKTLNDEKDETTTKAPGEAIELKVTRIEKGSSDEKTVSTTQPQSLTTNDKQQQDEGKQVEPPKDVETSSPEDTRTAAKQTPVSANSKKADDQSPVLKDASTDAELYELENDDRVVSIRKLDDIIRESKIVLPEEVISNDWLVLNVVTRVIPTF